MVGKKQLIGNIDDINTFYTVLHNSTHVLRKGSLVLSVIKSVGLICEEVKGYACRYLKTIGKSINPTFHAWVVIECIAVNITKLRGILL